MHFLRFLNCHFFCGVGKSGSSKATSVYLKRSTRHLQRPTGHITIQFRAVVDDPVDSLRSTINLGTRYKGATLSQGVENLPLLEERLFGVGQTPVPSNIVQLLHDRGKGRILLRRGFCRAGQHLSLRRIIVPERCQRRLSIEMKHHWEAHARKQVKVGEKLQVCDAHIIPCAVPCCGQRIVCIQCHTARAIFCPAGIARKRSSSGV